jgi:hypothetical protein
MVLKEASILWSLWKQFLPLSVSDVTMATGDPMISATLANMPKATENLGALGIAKAIAVFFESPVIMFLHTSNTLAPFQKSRRALWKFMILSCGCLTAAMVLMTVPLVFDLIVGNAVKLPNDMISLVRNTLLLFVAWPAVIGWRRYYQGLLIRYHHSKAIAIAGFLRLFVVGLILLGGFYLELVGIYIAGAALMIGVLTEAVAVTIAAIKLGVTTPPPTVSAPNLPVNVRGIWKFYWPLAGSMLVVWGSRFILVAIIAGAVDANIALAAWPAAWGVVLLIANGTRMVQQVVIKNRGVVTDASLLFFAGTVGMLFTTILLFIATTQVGQTIMSAFAGHNATLMSAFIPVLTVCSVIPLLVAGQNALQGILMSENKTKHIGRATWIGSFVLILIGSMMIHKGSPGATAAAWAMLAASITECAYLMCGIISNIGFFNKFKKRPVFSAET